MHAWVYCTVGDNNKPIGIAKFGDINVMEFKCPFIGNKPILSECVCNKGFFIRTNDNFRQFIDGKGKVIGSKRVEYKDKVYDELVMVPM